MLPAQTHFPPTFAYFQRSKPESPFETLEFSYGVSVLDAVRGFIRVFAGPSDRYSTQVLNRAKFGFQNPLRQSHRNFRVIPELPEFLPADVIRLVVVFTGDAELKTTIPGGAPGDSASFNYQGSQR